MRPTKKSKREDPRDTYYVDQSIKAIETAIEQSQGKSPVEVRRAIRANYPFGNGDRKGREYKLWNREVLKVEERLGLPKQTRNCSVDPDSNRGPTAGMNPRAVVRTNLAY